MVIIQNYLNAKNVKYYFIQRMKIILKSHIIQNYVQYAKNIFAIFVIIIIIIQNMIIYIVVLKE